jgi:hypothetical protein
MDQEAFKSVLSSARILLFNAKFFLWICFGRCEVDDPSVVNVTGTSIGVKGPLFQS